MDISPTINLPFIMPQQTQKHVTYNEAMNQLDVLVQLVVISNDIAQEPETPKDGDACILPAQPAGVARSGIEANTLIVRRDGYWVNMAPQAGWRAWVRDVEMMVVFDGATWRPLTLGSSNGGGGTDTGPFTAASIFGVNTEADITNRLSVKSDAVLISHDDVTPGSGDTRLLLNKEAEGETSSIIWESGFTALAELGLTRSNDVSLKVTPDGTDWQTALTTDQSSAHVGIGETSPQAPLTVSGRTQSSSFSCRVTEELATDTATSVPTPAVSGLAIVYPIGRTGRDDDFPNMNHAGAVWFDAGTSLQAVKGFDTSRFAVSNTTVARTTGSAGHTTVSVQNGHIQVENRSGSPYKYSLIFLV